MGDYYVHPYIPNSVPSIKKEMLEEIKASSADELYSEITDSGPITVAPDGSLLGLLLRHGIDFGYVMVKLGSDGEHLWNKTVLGQSWDYNIYSIRFSIAPTGLAYIVSSLDWDIQITAYNIGEYSIPPSKW